MAVWIDDESRLSAWLQGIRARGRLAVDCEANGFHAYRPRLCLVQLACEPGPGGAVRDEDVALVDPLALDGRLRALDAVLSDPGLEKIMHGAANDVRMFDRDAGISIKGVVDTEIAARLLGFPRSGLASLASELAGRSLSKAGQRFDWARRPLPEKALHYAAEDVEPLFTIRDSLVSRLERLGRREWLEEECRALEALRWEEPEFPTGRELLGRVKGSHELPVRQQEVLKALLTWREKEAARRDVPAIRVAEPGTLRRIARSSGRGADDLESLDLPGSLAGRYGRAILAAVRRGLRAGPEDDPSARRRGPRSGPVDPARMEELKTRRKEASRSLGIDPGTLCPTEVLREIARRPTDGIGELVGDRLRRWQAEAMGLEI